MNFIYEGMSPEELAAKRAELESELMAAQFEHEFESVQMMHELRLKDIEKQIILENCSIEKVADLYANEEDLYTEAEEGLINKFFNWLLNIVKAISERYGKCRHDFGHVNIDSKFLFQFSLYALPACFACTHLTAYC